MKVANHIRIPKMVHPTFRQAKKAPYEAFNSKWLGR